MLKILKNHYIKERNMEWRNIDPREIYTYNRKNIVILRPNTSGITYVAGTASIDTKNNYSIITSFEDHKCIEDWDIDWWWIEAP